jgi:hypothetical protein
LEEISSQQPAVSIQWEADMHLLFTGGWLLVAGCWLLFAGYWLLAAGC